MAKYPDTPGFTGTLRPNRFEGDLHDLEIDGEIPAQLNGTYHRVHPDAQFSPMSQNDQFFNGDGMVGLFHFRGGKVDFKSRFAQRTSGNSSAAPSARCSVRIAILSL